MAKLKVAFSLCHVVEETEARTEGLYLQSVKEGKAFPSNVLEHGKKVGLD